MCLLVAQLCLTLCDPVDCSLPGFSVREILQTRILECIAISSPGELPNPETDPGSLAWQADFLPFESPGDALI